MTENIQRDEERAAAVAVAPRVTKALIDSQIAAVCYATGDEAFSKEDFVPPSLQLSTICTITMLNGFNFFGTSACVSPENFNVELGRQIAYENAYRQIWAMEGYLLAEHGKARHIELIASVCHEVNRVYCASLGDYSQPFWPDAPEWQKRSAIEGVLFHVQNPGAGPSASHESWLKQKAFEGWIYGEVKDPDATPPTHPCIVPYCELPREQRYKDKLFVAVINGMLGRIVNPSGVGDPGIGPEPPAESFATGFGSEGGGDGSRPDPALAAAFDAGEKVRTGNGDSVSGLYTDEAAAPNSATGGQDFGDGRDGLGDGLHDEGDPEPFDHLDR